MTTEYDLNGLVWDGFRRFHRGTGKAARPLLDTDWLIDDLSLTRLKVNGLSGCMTGIVRDNRLNQ